VLTDATVDHAFTLLMSAPLDNPLLELDNCIIVPHIASASKHTRDMMAFMSAQNLIAGLKGERLPNCMNKEVY
jgi:glyoxylate reductase